LSWWDKTQKKVETSFLDIDASEGTSEGCAEAIKHSMKKVNDAIAVLLKGSTMDSGGGGVLESLGLMYSTCDTNFFGKPCEEIPGGRITRSTHNDADAPLSI
jgi:glycerate kinase